MAIFYPASQLLADLAKVQDIPAKDYAIIQSLRGWNQYGLTIPQYNLLLDLFNKYVTVPAGPSQNLRNYNY